ncbi:ABC transporter ATP-binding protein [Brevibacterium daeguense]|nr:ABC transporter ATP-binding protein [Brevibacterium daeguense]
MSPAPPETGTPATRPTSGGLQLRGLVKRFGDFTAVDHVDLEIPPGGFFALLGPSGCGKTTALRMIAGLEFPTEGRIFLGGQDITGVKPHRRPVNTVFQSYALFPHMSVIDNVAFGLRRRKVHDARAKASQVLELVELSHLADRRPQQLSGGQQQRVALARAIVNEPEVLLLDEPLGALDMKLRRQMQLELSRIQREVGLTFIHVTHDQDEAMTMADIVAVMNEGRIEQLGPPEELYDQPETVFVANFLGKSNLIEAEVLGEDGPWLTIAAGSAQARLLSDRCVSRQGRLLVGIRPEKIAIAPVGSDDEGRHGTFADRDGEVWNTLAGGVVSAMTYTGVSTEYQVEVPGIGSVEVFAQNLAGDVLAIGDRVSLRWRAKYTFGLAGDEPISAGAEVEPG